MTTPNPALDHGLGGDYPTSWEQFVGQHQARSQLLTAARSAKQRNAVMEHVLLASHRSGIGKTSLALLIALELGRNVRVVSGKIPVNEARILLSDLNDGDVLLYDEIHMAVSGGQSNAEWMLHYLQDGVIAGPLGPEEQPKVTVIGCTTEPGRLPTTILGRFTYRPVLEAPSREDASMIALTLAQRMFPDTIPLPSTANLYAIADAASRQPRLMRSILRNICDVATTTEASNWDGENYDLAQPLSWLGLTEDGLDLTARRYLVALLRDFAGGAGQRALQDRLQEPGGLGQVESILSDKGLIAQTKAGRTLTAAGIKRAKALMQEAA